jgi:hypothetical protein
MKRLVLLVLLLALVMPAVNSEWSPTEAASIPRCTASSVTVNEYSFQGGAGSANYLFRIKEVGDRNCSLRGYAHVSFVGVYGYGFTPLKNAHSLSVTQVENRGKDGNDFGGLATRVPIPMVDLTSARSTASFWIYGVDNSTEGSGGVASRCITSFEMNVQLPGSARSLVARLARGQGFYFCGPVAVHPIVPGSSGSDPAMRLNFHFPSVK